MLARYVPIRVDWFSEARRASLTLEASRGKRKLGRSIAKGNPGSINQRCLSVTTNFILSYRYRRVGSSVLASGLPWLAKATKELI